jgi:tetratricopeptide (TPR) repeat protein
MAERPSTARPPWTPTPFAGAFAFDAETVSAHWKRLHACDAQPLPTDDAVRHVWALYHRGEFRQAFEAGLTLGRDGVTVANKACCIYANYLEPSEPVRLALFLETAERARLQAVQEPLNPAAWYWQAYALGRYSQGISVAKALAQGLGQRIRGALERTIEIQPGHADAHAALGAFHAEVIDKVGPLIGRMTYGARKDVGLAMYRKALDINPDSAMAHLEYARGLIMLEGACQNAEATRLYQRAAAIEPMDAKERLDSDLARAELHD